MNTPTRPRSLAVMAIVLAVVSTPSLLMGMVLLTRNPTALGAWSIIAGLGALLSAWGLWKLRRWAPLLFFAIVAINVVLVFIVKVDGVSSYATEWYAWLLPMIYAAVVLPQRSKLH